MTTSEIRSLIERARNPHSDADAPKHKLTDALEHTLARLEKADRLRNDCIVALKAWRKEKT